MNVTKLVGVRNTFLKRKKNASIETLISFSVLFQPIYSNNVYALHTILTLVGVSATEFCAYRGQCKFSIRVSIEVESCFVVWIAI